MMPSLSETSIEPQVEVGTLEAEETLVAAGAPWRVILFNDEVHSFDEVVLQVMKATGCGMREAAGVTLQAHNTGAAPVYSGEIEACLTVQQILREIALGTELRG